MAKIQWASEVGEPVVKGKVQQATVKVYYEDRLLGTYAISPDDAPSRLNNMTEWLRLALQVARGETDLLRRSWAKCQEKVVYKVNGGIGRKAGRNSNDNLFEYILKDAALGIDIRVEIQIVTRLHQAVYGQQIRAGDRVVKHRGPPAGIPYISKQTSAIMMPSITDGSGGVGGGGWFTFDNHEEFYEQHPEWRNKLETY